MKKTVPGSLPQEVEGLTLLLLLMARGLGGFAALKVHNRPGMALQAVQFTAVLLFIFVAYRHMPLADASSISRRQPVLVRLLLPLGGLSMLDAPGQPFHDPAANAVLFDTLRSHFVVSAARQLVE
eukprot:gene13562-18297_t